MHVYFVQSRLSGWVKIGHSTNLFRRLSKEIKPLAGDCLTLLAIEPGGEPREKALHRQFAASRLHNEQFAPTADLMGYIAALPHCPMPLYQTDLSLPVSVETFPQVLPAPIAPRPSGYSVKSALDKFKQGPAAPRERTAAEKAGTLPQR